MNRLQDYRWLRGVRDAWLARELVDPPTAVRERATSLFPSSSRPRPALIERVRAALIFDSRQPGLAAAGVRSAGVLDGPWQLLYRGDDVDIDLMVRPNQDGHTLNVRGQALSLVGHNLGAGVVEALPVDIPRPLRGEPRASVRSAMEPTGEFALPDLERGRYDVLVRIGAREIELTNVEL